jgi:DNA-binding MarR family transcriptional regulator
MATQRPEPGRKAPDSGAVDRHRSPGGRAIAGILAETFRLNGRLLEAGDRMTRDLGLSSARWQVLGAVGSGSSGGSDTVASIARRMGIRRQSVQRTVNALRVDGFVVLRENPNHRRARLVKITDKGARALSASFERQTLWAHELSAAVGAEDLDRTLEVMTALRSRLDDDRA